MTHPTFERGWCSDIQVTGGQIQKVTREAYPTAADAQHVAGRIGTYALELAQEPLQVAPLVDVRVLDSTGGYRVAHTYDLVDGPSLVRLPMDGARQQATADVMSQIAGMRTHQGEPDSLLVPIDAKATNFHVDGNGPQLIDIFPALSRLPDGSFPIDALHAGNARGRRTLWEWSSATKAGAMTKILSTAIDRGDTGQQTARHILARTDSWCYDTLPATLDGKVKDRVRRQIGTHFMPYFARVAYDRAWTIANR